MVVEIAAPISVERMLGDELASAAEALLAEMANDSLGPEQAAQWATVRALLAVYRQLRGSTCPGDGQAIRADGDR